MRRAEFLQLTGLDAVAFNALARRGWRPLGAVGPARVWGDYTLFDAFALDLTLMLNTLGMTQRQAATLVRVDGPRLFEDGVSFGEFAKLSRWFGFALVGCEEPNAEGPGFIRSTLTLPIMVAPEGLGREIRQLRGQLANQSVYGVGLINASERASALIERMSGLGLRVKLDPEISAKPTFPAKEPR